jgi:DNA-binding NarL/FixJ family response regulator
MTPVIPTTQISTGRLFGPWPSEVHLTPREMQALRLVTEGDENWAIAQTMGISCSTVKLHLHNIFDKTGLHNRVSIAVWAVRNNIL